MKNNNNKPKEEPAKQQETRSRQSRNQHTSKHFFRQVQQAVNTNLEEAAWHLHQHSKTCPTKVFCRQIVYLNKNTRIFKSLVFFWVFGTSKTLLLWLRPLSLDAVWASQSILIKVRSRLRKKTEPVLKLKTSNCFFWNCRAEIGVIVDRVIDMRGSARGARPPVRWPTGSVTPPNGRRNSKQLC